MGIRGRLPDRRKRQIGLSVEAAAAAISNPHESLIQTSGPGSRPGTSTGLYENHRLHIR
ncbi:hypothetical protein ATC1_1252 [Flexilinea flocculi]|uniref:Uncharacterized protein n=1 Tax=Flexilinea flocculi TaxID=1678840 RepID=A0A0K8PA34_9CHLR|nr:hypothetical protein ATC1_1252 [Flexilinea flocculi]